MGLGSKVAPTPESQAPASSAAQLGRQEPTSSKQEGKDLAARALCFVLELTALRRTDKQHTWFLFGKGLCRNLWELYLLLRETEGGGCRTPSEQEALAPKLQSAASTAPGTTDT